MGTVTCEKTGKCPTGMIASTGLDGLRDILEAYHKAGSTAVEIEITVKGAAESTTYSFNVDSTAEMIEILRLTTGK